MKLLTINSVIPLSDKVRRAVFEAFGGICFYSGTKLTREEAHVDHHVSKAKGGRDVASNYVLCRSDLNIRKHAAELPNLATTQAYLSGITGPKVIRLLNREIFRELRRSTTPSTKVDFGSNLEVQVTKRHGRMTSEQHLELQKVFAEEEDLLTMKALAILVGLPNGHSCRYELRSEHLEGELIIEEFDRPLILGMLYHLSHCNGARPEWFSCVCEEAKFPNVAILLSWTDGRVMAGVNSSMLHEMMATKTKAYFRLSAGALVRCLVKNSSQIREEWGTKLDEHSDEVRPVTGDVTFTDAPKHQKRFGLIERIWMPGRRSRHKSSAALRTDAMAATEKQ
jgi:hypothetical protein